eukprot:1090215-Karenia_brevis.AAC.1
MRKEIDSKIASNTLDAEVIGNAVWVIKCAVAFHPIQVSTEIANEHIAFIAVVIPIQNVTGSVLGAALVAIHMAW